MQFTSIAIGSIVLALVCSLVILIDIVRHPQKMSIMNIVWPVTALYAGPLAILTYNFIGRRKDENSLHSNATPSLQKKQKPFWQSVLVGSLHCGSGCTLGDLIVANALLFIPFTLFGSKLYGEWTIDFVLAFLIGIIFQYYAIKPMRKLSSGKAIIAALKADTLSLTFWQIGMYGWMAIADFLIFKQVLNASMMIFWLMMQIAMLFGLLTAYPVNWWLIKKGIKEQM